MKCVRQEAIAIILLSSIAAAIADYEQMPSEGDMPVLQSFLKLVVEE